MSYRIFVTGLTMVFDVAECPKHPVITAEQAKAIINQRLNESQEDCDPIIAGVITPQQIKVEYHED